MYKSFHSKFQVNNDNYNKLIACNKISALIWNKCLELNKFHRLITNKAISEADLKLILKKIYPLHSQSVQAIIEQYIENRKDTYLAIQKGFKNRFPYKSKKFFPTTWKVLAFKFKNSHLFLSLGKLDKFNSFIKINLPKRTFSFLKDKNIKKIELIYKEQLLLSFVYSQLFLSKMVICLILIRIN